VKARGKAVHRSLKGRALQLLAQREHSRAEMRRKLLVQARADAAAAAGASAGAISAADEPEVSAAADPNAQVEAVLDWLEAHNYLSQERFVESRVHARAARFGNLRIRRELAQHAVALSPEAAQALQATELERARAVWERKYPTPPADAAGQARQARFLAGRGFSPDVIRKVLRAAGRTPGADEAFAEPGD
jgi:regulatory protein